VLVSVVYINIDEKIAELEITLIQDDFEEFFTAAKK